MRKTLSSGLINFLYGVFILEVAAVGFLTLKFFLYILLILSFGVAVISLGYGVRDLLFGRYGFFPREKNEE